MKFRDWHNNLIDIPEDRSYSWRPSAYALTINNGTVLCVKAAQHDQWELPGGGVELGETPAQALQREVLEETGYRVEAMAEVPLLFKNDFFYAADIDEYFQSLFMVFRAKLISDPQPRQRTDTREIAAVRWIGFEELDNYRFHPFLRPLLEQERNGR